MVTNEKIMNAMAKSSDVMSKVNKSMDVEKMNQIMQKFSKENMKMDMTDEMLADALDGDGEDDIEVDDAMSQVLDEIGIETSRELGSIRTGKVDLSKSEESEADELLTKLGIKH